MRPRRSCTLRNLWYSGMRTCGSLSSKRRLMRNEKVCSTREVYFSKFYNDSAIIKAGFESYSCLRISSLISQASLRISKRAPSTFGLALNKHKTIGFLPSGSFLCMNPRRFYADPTASKVAYIISTLSVRQALKICFLYTFS